MKHILYATDFSSCAYNALNYAIAIAKKTNAKITLHHSCQAQLFATEIPLEHTSDENVLQNAIYKLSTYTELEAFKKGTVLFEEDICFGDAADNIIKLANNIQADLIIMGNTGSTGLMKKLIGSTSLKVMEKVWCPVLLIPENAKYHDFTKIIYATDYRAIDLKNIEATAAIAKLYNAEMIIVHMSLVGFTDSLERETFKLFKEEVVAKVAYNKISFQLQVGLNVDEVLEAVAADENADLIVMSIRDTNIIDKLFGQSATKKMVHHTRVPVLSFKTK